MAITLEKYNQIIEELNNKVNYYDRMNFSNNRYCLYLANGDILNVRISKNNIAHLLGVNLDYLKMSNMFKPNMSSYDCLKYFLDNSYTFGNLVSQEKLKFDSMFSPKIDEKLESFIDNINIRTDDIYFILKYDEEKIYKIEEKADICDYYIVRKKQNKYYLLGLIKNEYVYYPVTSRKYDDYFEYDKFISKIAIKQDITYPYLMRVENDIQGYKSSFSLKIDDKEQMLDKTINVSQKYEATAAVAKDFAFLLNKMKNEKNNTSTNISVLKLLTDSVKTGNVLDSHIIDEICGNIELNEEVNNLISVCNDLVCSNVSCNSLALDNYSKISEENKSLKEELECLRKQLIESETKNEQLQEKNNLLEEQNNTYQQDINVLEEAYQKVFKK